MAQLIVIVEDEPMIAELAMTYLQHAGFATKWFDHGSKELFSWLQEHNPAVVVLDLMLPGIDGLELCRKIREFSQVPIIMTTAKVQEVDRLVGLEMGADDYLCKPYSIKELVARIKVILRRVNQTPLLHTTQRIRIDESNFSVIYQQQQVELTLVLFNLFKLLYSNPNRIYSRQQIMDLVYSDFREINDRTVDSHIRNLRKKLTELAMPVDPIRSIYGAGYKFVWEDVTP